MFISAIVPLSALDAPPPGTNHFLGRAAHALFLDLVRRADPALAASLHEPRGDKPFTLSAPFSRDREKGGLGTSWLRVTTFEPRLSRLLVEQILPNLPREVRLASTQFATGTPITDRAAHPWADTVDAEKLVNRWFDAGARLERQIMFQFDSPTAHRQIHRNVLFPQPAQLWGGWLRAWNTYAQPTFEDDLIAQVEANVAISRYALKTEVVDFGEFREAGWMGRAAFTCFSSERALTRVLNLLADFAFFCGTGYKTTQGMGMTRRI